MRNNITTCLQLYYYLCTKLLQISFDLTVNRLYRSNFTVRLCFLHAPFIATT